MTYLKLGEEWKFETPDNQATGFLITRSEKLSVNNTLLINSDTVF